MDQRGQGLGVVRVGPRRVGGPCRAAGAKLGNWRRGADRDRLDTGWGRGGERRLDAGGAKAFRLAPPRTESDLYVGFYSPRLQEVVMGWGEGQAVTFPGVGEGRSDRAWVRGLGSPPSFSSRAPARRSNWPRIPCTFSGRESRYPRRGLLARLSLSAHSILNGERKKQRTPSSLSPKL